jgi:hypothetical protein
MTKGTYDVSGVAGSKKVGWHNKITHHLDKQKKKKEKKRDSEREREVCFVCVEGWRLVKEQLVIYTNVVNLSLMLEKVYQSEKTLFDTSLEFVQIQYDY